MPDLTVEHWREFLQARLLQEAGKDAEALPVFEKLAATYPTNPHVQASRAFALLRSKQGDEAVPARLNSAYSRAAAALTGDADTPQAWTKELKELLDTLPGGVKAEAAVAW